MLQNYFPVAWNVDLFKKTTDFVIIIMLVLEKHARQKAECTEEDAKGNNMVGIARSISACSCVECSHLIQEALKQKSFREKTWP